MAVLKVSDLSTLNNIAYNDHNFENSLYEISYADSINEEYIQYKSMNITHKFLRDAVISGVVADSDVEFRVPKHFLSTVYFHDSIELSGNLIVNKDLPDNIINDNNYISYIKESNNTIIATGTRNGTGNNILSAKNANIFYSYDGTEIYDKDKLIASFKKEGVQITEDTDNLTVNTPSFFNKTVTFNNGADAIFKDTVTIRGNLSCYNPALFNNNLSCNGTAYFKNDIVGCCLSAKWADVAELYESDKNYDPGTLVKFGGEYEITIADDDVNAVVTTSPGLVLNSNISANTYIGIALVGRTPVLVDGICKKFDDLYLNDEKPGYATTKKSLNNKIIGKALQNKDIIEPALIECVVQMKF